MENVRGLGFGGNLIIMIRCGLTVAKGEVEMFSFLMLLSAATCVQPAGEVNTFKLEKPVVGPVLQDPDPKLLPRSSRWRLVPLDEQKVESDEDPDKDFKVRYKRKF